MHKIRGPNFGFNLLTLIFRHFERRSAEWINWFYDSKKWGLRSWSCGKAALYFCSREKRLLLIHCKKRHEKVVSSGLSKNFLYLFFWLSVSRLGTSPAALVNVNRKVITLQLASITEMQSYSPDLTKNLIFLKKFHEARHLKNRFFAFFLLFIFSKFEQIFILFKRL